MQQVECPGVGISLGKATHPGFIQMKICGLNFSITLMSFIFGEEHLHIAPSASLQTLMERGCLFPIFCNTVLVFKLIGLTWVPCSTAMLWLAWAEGWGQVLQNLWYAIRVLIFWRKIEVFLPECWMLGRRKQICAEDGVAVLTSFISQRVKKYYPRYPKPGLLWLCIDLSSFLFHL